MDVNSRESGLMQAQERRIDSTEESIMKKYDENEIVPFEVSGGNTVTSPESILAQTRNFLYLEAVQKSDTLSEIDKQIIERQHQRLEEELREESKKAELSKSEQNAVTTPPPEPDKLVAILTKCYITGCVCHTINRTGNIIKHYTSSELQIPAARISKGYTVWKRHQNCTCVEIYTRHITVINGNQSLVYKE